MAAAERDGRARLPSMTHAGDPHGFATPRRDASYFDAQYNVRAGIPEHAAIFARWARASAAARATEDARCNLVYGPHADERLDLFPVADPRAPLLVFIHGGFWRAFGKDDFSWIAPAFNAAGIAVAVPHYSLAPATSIEDIVRQMLRASAWLWRHAEDLGVDRKRMFVAGHSAGGHMGAMLLAALWREWASDLPDHIYQGAVLLSGVYDLEAVMRSHFLNVDLRLTPERVRLLAPLALRPAVPVPVLTAVGGRESDEFKRQNAAFGVAWHAVLRADIAAPDADHLTLCDHLVDPASALFAQTVALCRG